MNYQIDGQPASDTAFYAVACDPAQSVVVEACAGAGKTWMLVSRIVRALLAGTAPSQILAITFTRKAAGEMQQRLHQWLRSWAEADHGERVQQLRLRGLDAAAAEAAAPRLAQLWDELLASGGGVQIRTFHAWFGQLLRMAPLTVLEELGLHPGMALIEDTRELQAPLMQRFARAVLADAQASADHLALGQRVGRDTLGKWLEQAWGRRVEIERADAAGTLAGAVPPPATAWAHPLDGWPQLRPLLTEVTAALGAAKGKKSQDAAAALVAALALPDAAAAYAAARAALFTATGPRKLTQEPAPEFVAGCEALDVVAAALAQQDAHDDHRRMVNLTRLLLAEYRALKRERGLVDMNDLETLAVTLLADSQWAPWLHERLDVRFRHVLLDEFQDTSPLQWQALAPWLAGYAGAGGGSPFSVFIVGDPKQSIYRFRRAEPRVFAAAQDFVATVLAGRRLAANHTRRNTQQVLDTVNAVFEQAQAAGQYAGFAPHTSGATEAPLLRGVYHLPLVPRPERDTGEAADDDWRDSLTTPRREVGEPLLAEEARRIAAAIAALVRPADGRPAVPPGAIYVLARRRVVLAEVGRALRALHLPHVQANDLVLTDVAEVRDVLALLDVLASPGHDAALAQVLKSPLFGASDADLMALAAHRAPTWLEALAGQTSEPLARAAELLPRWARLARRWPPHDVLDHVLHEGDMLPRLLAACDPAERAQTQAALTALTDETLALDGGRYLTLYAFVRALKKRLHKLAATPTPDAVQLLTVHGAKGLEADVVFLADTQPNARGGAQPGLLVDWPVTHAHPTRAAFVAGPKTTPPSLRALAEDEAHLAACEQLNLLYVALTRARGALVVSAVQPHRRASQDASWWERLQPLTQPWPEAWQAAPAAAQPDAPAELPDWRALAAPAAAPLEAAPTSSTLGRTGEAFHRLLQWGRADDTAAAQAAAAFELDAAAAAQAQAAAARVLASPALAALEQGADWRADEVPMVWQGQSLRIDRLLKRGDTWWVLDHKLNHAPQHDPALRAQLATYAAALAALEPGSPIRTAFVTGAGEVVEVG